jgi:hypothetical protein
MTLDRTAVGFVIVVISASTTLSLWRPYDVIHIVRMLGLLRLAG